MQFKYRNQFPFLSTMLALLEMAQSAMPQKQQKQQNQKQNKAHKEFSFEHCIKIKRKQLRKYVEKFRNCLSKFKGYQAKF